MKPPGRVRMLPLSLELVKGFVTLRVFMGCSCGALAGASTVSIQLRDYVYYVPYTAVVLV